MRFLMMHKNDPNTEAGKKPDMKLIAEMGAFIGGHAEAGRLIDGAGLGPSKYRSRVTARGGKTTVKHGPYKGEHELPAAMLQLEVKTRDEAIRWAEKYGAILGDGEIEVGKVTEPWDLGMMPMPEHAPMHVLLIEKADEATEGAGRTADQQAALGRLKQEMTDAGVLQKSVRLQPSTKAKRLHVNANRMRIVDGPFSESKELIGGFAILELTDFDDAIAQCARYAEILGGTLEMDVRLLADVPE